ncbi:hypothetical protein [Desulfoluna spongiiphila]|uniref:hypothetical protein n=1 Tax=Desulfoluna spongiiphila TaxID=419481 RepID=UPI001251F63C|nr:hypothetical protein [Desulfoluna spongiiphila]VVS91832.1 hypothetical protein DBB_14000 [Desulfoluna spongiiphila]
MIKKYVFACLLVLFLSGFVHASPKDRSVEISPKIVTDESSSDWTLGLSYDVNYPWSKLEDLRFGEAESFVLVQLKGTVLEDKDLNNEALVSQLTAGFSFLGGQAVSPDFSPGMDPNAGAGASKDKSNWGYIYGGFNARHEAIQSFDEQNLAAGFEAGYINIRTEGLFSFIPSVIVAGEYVNGVASDIEEDTYSRLRAEASLKCAFGELLFEHKALMPLGLRLDGRYNRAWDMDDKLDVAGQDEVSYLAAALTYGSTMTLSVLKNPVFFIRYSDGRIPPNTADERVVTAGVTLPVL